MPDTPPVAPAVLIVEDALTTRQILELSFRNAGYEPVAVADGAMAMSVLKKLVPVLVITDYRLADGDGYRICKMLRTDRVYSGVKVIMVSGLREADCGPGGFPGAYDLFVEKPFSLRGLLESARSLLLPPPALRPT